jgi:hypothetical protein
VTASKINPHQWKGQERDGGYIARNKKPTSTSSPQWRGTLYIPGIGWYWVSAWEHGSKADPLLALRVQEMTDEQATKFCQPKAGNIGKPKGYSPEPAPSQNGAAASDSDIPF